MSVANGQDPAGIDPSDLQLPRGATSSGTPQASTPSVNIVEVRASFSWLEMVLLDCSACNQQATL